MDSIRIYILSLLAAAMICSIVNTWLAEKGTHGTIIKLLSGLFLTITFLSPLVEFKVSDISEGLSDYSVQAQTAAAVGQESYANNFADIIKKRTEAYILDKASGWNLDLQIEVTLSESDPPIPDSVLLIGDVSPYAKRQLSYWMENELAIVKEKQTWR